MRINSDHHPLEILLHTRHPTSPMSTRNTLIMRRGGHTNFGELSRRLPFRVSGTLRVKTQTEPLHARAAPRNSAAGWRPGARRREIESWPPDGHTAGTVARASQCSSGGQAQRKSSLAHSVSHSRSAAEAQRSWALSGLAGRSGSPRAALLLTPGLLGQLRLNPSPRRGQHRTPAHKRTPWWRG
jgi:hypothetical protein